ncbi:MAG: MFS transporter [Chloroflexota bacterium]
MVPRSGPGSGLYYGWILVLILGITETTSWGILYYSFTVFLAPMEQELGWSRAAMTGAFSLALLLSGIAAVPVGRWLDGHGARLLMTAGSIAGTVLVIAWSWVDNLVAFYLLWAAIGLIMAATLYDPAFAVVAVWFRRRRARAMLCLTLMAGLASTIFLPIASLLVGLQGWRAALVTLAVTLGVTTIPLHALFLRRRPQDLGLQPDGEPAAEGTSGRSDHRDGITVSQALRQPTFRWLAIAFCLYDFASVGVPVHLVAFLSERGLDPTLAATATGFVGLMQLLGRITFAPLESRLPPRIVSSGIFVLQVAAFGALVLLPLSAGVIVMVVLLGVSRGAATLARPLIIADLYGTAQFASISGVLALFLTIAKALAPVAIGAGYDWLGGYDPVMWIVLALATAACGAILLADRRERRAP